MPQFLIRYKQTEHRQCIIEADDEAHAIQKFADGSNFTQDMGTDDYDGDETLETIEEIDG